jgi:hypothetical protein
LILNDFRGIGHSNSFFITRESLWKFHQSLIRPLREKGARSMKFDEIKAAVMILDESEQRRVVLELLPAIWPTIVGDDSCLRLIRKLVDAESVKKYQEEHLDHI